MMDRSWIVNRSHYDRIQPKYLEGVQQFLDFSFKDRDEGSVLKCPCVNCNMTYSWDRKTMWYHLMQYGILSDYNPWIYHGEDPFPLGAGEGSGENGVEDEYLSADDDMLRDDMVPLIHEAMTVKFTSDTEGQPGQDIGALSQQKEKSDELPESVAKLFKSVEEDLYPGCKTFSKLEFILTLLHLKVSHKWSDKSFSLLLSSLHRAFGFDISFPKNSYEAKKYTKDLGLGYLRIDACINHCILFRKEFADYDACPKCGCSRWKDSINAEDDSDGEVSHNGSKVPQLVLRHFPTSARLQRMYMSSKLAKQMRWHKDNRPDGHQAVQIVESQCQSLFRQWRYRLKEEFFVGKSIVAAVKNCPKDVDPEEWKWIVEKYWGSENQKSRSRTNKLNRSKQKLKATQGSRSTARVLEMLRKNNHHSTTSQASEASNEFTEAGNEPQPEYITLWENTKRHKDHSMDKFAEEKLEEFKQLHQQEIEEFGVDNLTVEETYMKVLGTSSGYIKGLGFGPKPPKRRKDGSHEEYASFSQQMVDQFDNLERSSRERENKLNEQIQELKKDKAIMLEEMENMKKSAAEREERMRSEIFEMVKQQLQCHK